MTWRGWAVRRANRVLRRLDIQVVKARSAEEYLLRGYQDVTRDEFAFRCDPHHGPFWGEFQSGRWEPETFAVLRRFLHADSVYYDLGAWIGPTVLYAAKLSRAVFAFEPDPIAYAYLLENVTKNDLTNVRAFNLAVAATERTAVMRSFGKTMGDSMTSLLPAAQASSGWLVTTVTVKTLVERFSCAPPDFMKIDIEGGEFELMPAIGDYLSQWKPVIYLSLHAPLIAAEHRERMLEHVAQALSMYPYAIDDYGAWSRGERGAFPLQTLAGSAFKDEFGSLLLLPQVPERREGGG